MQKEKFTVTGMTCAACSAHVEKAVKQVPGVCSVNVNLLGGSMVVEHDGDSQPIIDAVVKAGYGASLPQSNTAAPTAPARPNNEAELRSMKQRLVWSLVFMVPLFYLSMGHMMGWPLPHIFHGAENALTFALTAFLLTLPPLIINQKYFRVGFKALWNRSPNMDSLIAVGASAAVVYGIAALYAIGYGLGHDRMDLVEKYTMELYFESAAMIVTLITVGKFLETRSKGRTGQAIARLLDLSPKTATVLRDGGEVEIPVEHVQLGDLLLVRPGKAMPVDGVVVEGQSAVDQSALTGESIPVDKGPGDTVISASVNGSGVLTVRATRVGQDTTLSQMVRLVEDAAGSKAPIARLADQVSGIFVPVVMSISLLTAIVWLVSGHSIGQALTSAVAVLVISCPCALGLATPVAIMVGTGKGAEHGILIKSAEALETLRDVDTIVLDKTGTVTEGKPKVTDIVPLSDLSEAALLQAAASIEYPSEHPLGAAIVTEADRRGLARSPVTDFAAIHGKGVRATLNGIPWAAGNRAFLAELGIADTAANVSNELAEAGKTPLYFVRDGKLVGILAVADTVKDTSTAAIEGFRKLGLSVVLLTGDNQRTAKAIGRQLGLSNVIAEVLPTDKERHVAQLQQEGHRVAMVGDGINDAPALARSDVGLAIGAGADIAMESADIVLMKSSLTDAVTAVELSRATIRNIKENLFWAFFYNVICIPVAAGALYPLLHLQLSPMFAAAAMSLSSVCVVTNALRLRSFRPSLHSVETVTQESTRRNESMNELVITVNGMMCGHCAARVEKAATDAGASAAKVDLEAKTVTCTVSDAALEGAIRTAITEAGYEVV